MSPSDERYQRRHLAIVYAMLAVTVAAVITTIIYYTPIH